MVVINDKILSTEDRKGQLDPITESQGTKVDENTEKIMTTKMDSFLTFDDLKDEGTNLDLEQLMTRAQHPFANYNSRIIKQRVYPRLPELEVYQLEELKEYCRERRYFHPKKMIIKKVRDDETGVRMEKIERCDLKKQEMLDWIEKCETLTFPTVAVVFSRYRKRRKVPYNRVIYSYVAKSFTDVIFDKVWVSGDGRRKEGWFSIVPDHTVRAQLLFRYNAKQKGRLTIDKRFTFLARDNHQMEPLREVFLLCQKKRKVIEENLIASSGDTAEKELFADDLPASPQF